MAIKPCKKLKIKVLSPGLLASIQDSGRPARHSDGIPPGGAADTLSHRLANFLAGNDAGAATIEMAGGIFSASAEQSGWLACVGGAMFLDDKAIPGNRSVFVPAGTKIKIGPSATGNYAYLAIPGGWDVPEVLGSRSTCLVAGFGGLQGRGLRKGDVLQSTYSSDDPKSSDEYNECLPKIMHWFIPARIFSVPASENTIRVLPGPESDWWPAEDEQRFFETDFIVSKNRDRMGVRLEGASVPSAKRSAMLSTAVMPGTVQIPPGGWPIALLADAQTTGGYPRIAQVIAVDMPLLAQIPTGQSIRFQKVTLEDAERLYFERENLLRKIQLALQFKLHEHGIR